MPPNHRQVSGTLLSCGGHNTYTFQALAQSTTGSSASLIVTPIIVSSTFPRLEDILANRVY